MEIQRELDILLHPRLPPLLTSHPPIEATSLFRTENEANDNQAREDIGVRTIEDIYTAVDVTMKDSLTAPAVAPQPETVEHVPQAGRRIAEQPISRPQVTPFVPQVPTPTPVTNVEVQMPSASAPKPPTLRETLRVETIGSSSTFTQMPQVPMETMSNALDSDEEEDEAMPEIDLESDSE